jgi:hypothetical protein
MHFLFYEKCIAPTVVRCHSLLCEPRAQKIQHHAINERTLEQTFLHVRDAGKLAKPFLRRRVPRAIQRAGVIAARVHQRLQFARDLRVNRQNVGGIRLAEIQAVQFE